MFLLLFAGCSDEISKESYTSETVMDDLADKITWRKDGKEMVLISAGHFYTGDHSGRDETALRHKVELDAFYIDSTEVTVGQFRRFLAERGYQYKGNCGEASRRVCGMVCGGVVRGLWLHVAGRGTRHWSCPSL